jgi:membrane fusion protein (multidrug efflux system)
VDAVKVQVLLENGQPYALPGRLLFTDLSVDPATGQVNLRAEVPNPNGLLLPGLYVRARLAQAQVGGAMLLPQQAVTRGSQSDTVMVVAPDGTVAPRPVKIAGAQEQSWIVTGGLKAGEQVMVEGAMKLMMAPEVFLLPPQAVTRGAQGDTVMVAGADGKAAPRPVKVKSEQGPDLVISEGLKTGDRVMVDGAPKMMMGMKVVKPVPWQPGRAAGAALGAAKPAAAPASAASN